MKNNTINPSITFFFLSSLEAFGAIFLVFSIPSDPKNAQIFGFSLSRLGLLIVLLFIALFFYYLGWHSYRKASWIIDLENRTSCFFSIGNRGFYAATLLLMIFAHSFLFYLVIQAEQYAAWQGIYYKASPLMCKPEGFRKFFCTDTLYRLSPLILWIALVSLQGFLLFAWLYRERIKSFISQISKTYLITFLAIIFVICTITLWISITGIGLVPDTVAWGAPGTPILLWQSLLAFDLSLLLFILTHLISTKFPQSTKAIDPALCVILWLSSVIIWQQTSFNSSYFAPTPVPPNHEFYPYSDAALHDVNAQFLLIGEGLGGHGGSVIRRPLYSLFLAFIHLIAGQNYQNVVFMQILFLSLSVVCLYILGGLIHNRFSGLLCAWFFILQEHNAIALSNIINVSHSKLLMSDPFTAFWVILFTIFVIIWQRRHHHILPLFIAGGVLGAAVLVRPQAIFLGVVVILLTLYYAFRQPKKFLFQLLIFFTGILCTISPWIIRNYHLTKTIVFDEPSIAQIGMIAQRYSISPQDEETAVYHLPGEKEGEYSARMTRQIIQFAIQHPQEVLNFVAAHFFHNIINLINTLPIAYEPISPEDFVRSHPYWLDLDRKNYQIKQPYEDKISLGLVLIFLAIGISSTVIKKPNKTRVELFALIPLFIYLSYNLSNAVSRNSGWRFLLPGDWVGLLYYAMGVSGVLTLIHSALNASPGWAFSRLLVINAENQKSVLQKHSTPKYSLIFISALVLFLFGSLIPVSEKLFPIRYPQKPKQELLAMLSQSEWATQYPSRFDSLSQIIEDDNISVIWGRILYPRFYPAYEGITSGSPNPLTRIRDYNRMSFQILSNTTKNVLLPITNPPPSFPNGSDGIVIGCFAGDHISAYIAAYSTNPNSEHKKWQVVTQDISSISFCK